MKKVVLAVAMFLSLASFAMAWDCPAGQIRQQAPPGTPTTTPYYDVVEGIAFICVPATPTTPSQPATSSQSQSQQQSQNTTTTNNNSNNNVSKANSTSSSSAKSNSNSNASSNSNSASTATVSNSGNSSSSAQGGNANATGGSASNNSSGNSSSYSSTYTQVQQNPGAFAPTAAFTTSPCSKGFSGGASTPSVAATLGLVLTDKGCDSRQTAAVFYAIGNPTAAAKVLCSTDASKRAHLTLDECEALVVPQAPVVVPTPAPVVPQPTIIVVPTPAPVAAVVPPTPVAVPVAAITPIVVSRDHCSMTRLTLTNVCKRMLDDVALRLENNTNARLVLVGPMEASTAVAYLHNRVDATRIQQKFSDDQNLTLSVEVVQ